VEMSRFGVVQVKGAGEVEKMKEELISGGKHGMQSNTKI